MSKTKPKSGGEIDEVYQIRLKNELKSKFMESCHELALNPSAVLRMLMEDWTQKTRDTQKRQKLL